MRNLTTGAGYRRAASSPFAMAHSTARDLRFTTGCAERQLLGAQFGTAKESIGSPAAGNDGQVPAKSFRWRQQKAVTQRAR